MTYPARNAQAPSFRVRTSDDAHRGFIAAIGVMDEAGSGPLALHRHQPGGDHDFGVQGFAPKIVSWAQPTIFRVHKSMIAAR